MNDLSIIGLVVVAAAPFIFLHISSSSVVVFAFTPIYLNIWVRILDQNQELEAKSLHCRWPSQLIQPTHVHQKDKYSKSAAGNVEIWSQILCFGRGYVNNGERRAELS